MSHAATLSRALPRPLMQAGSALAIGAALALAPALPTHAQEAATNLTDNVTDTMGGRPLSFSDLAEQVSPSVVNITTTTMVSGRSGPQDLFPEGSPFEDFFRDFQEDGDGRPRRSSALGSGFVISEDGYIVTNNHVIEGADEIEIEFFPSDETAATTLPAKVIGTDANTDIALLKVESDTPLPFVSFGDSNGEEAETGDWVMAMGNPLGQGFSISAGIISARGRSLAGTYDDYIQTDAAINRGNSGGPLFNMAGEVIGVNTAILSPNGGSIGIGFAMSSAVVENVVDQLKEFGETRRGWLGVRIQDVTPDMVDAIEGLDTPAGAMVTDVPEGPAMEAGVLSGDVILSFDGAPVDDTRELVRMVGNAPVGKDVALTVLREGDTEELTVTLGRRETAQGNDSSGEGEPMEPAEAQILGLTVAPLDDELAKQFNIEGMRDGLVVLDVDPASEAADKGLAPGDMITEAGQSGIATVEDLEERVQDSLDAGRKSILLLIRRGGDPRFVALPLTD